MKSTAMRLGLLMLATFSIMLSFAQNNAIFKGGINDGWHSATYIQNSNSIFHGGNGDGWQAANYIQAATNIFHGGNGDGWNALNFSQVSLNIFNGGIGDGWNSKNMIQSSATIYKGGAGDGWASTYRPQGPLPVSILYFNAQKYKETSSLLNWETAFEINSAFFDIERSEDAVNYSKIGYARAAGNAHMATGYQFIDKEPIKGMNYYRLKQVDLDGRFVYTPSRLVKFNDTENNLVKVYPNPTTDKLLVELTPGMIDQPLVINISNELGMVVYQLRSPMNREKMIFLNLSGWVKGSYFVQVKTTTITNTSKIVIQ